MTDLPPDLRDLLPLGDAAQAILRASAALGRMPQRVLASEAHMMRWNSDMGPQFIGQGPFTGMSIMGVRIEHHEGPLQIVFDL